MKNEIQVMSYNDAERAAQAMAASGLFADTKTAAQAIVKILAGQEMGFGPFASMTGVAIIQGKPAVGANLQAAAIKRTGKYNFRVLEITDDVCELEFTEAGKPVGRSRFSMADAKAAGLADKENWKKWPRNMLFARALSNGVKWYAPDIFNGATVYTPDELGASEDEDGNIVTGEVVAEARSSFDIPAKVSNAVSERPYSPDVLKERMQKRTSKYKGQEAIAADRNLLAASLAKVFTDNTQRYEFCQWLTGESSTKKIPSGYVFAMLEWLKVASFTDLPDSVAAVEAHTGHTEALKTSGQAELL